MVFLRWEYDEGYDVKTNKVYKSAGRIFPFLPPKYVKLEERHEYRVKFDVSIYFCDSPDLQAWIVRRKIYGIVVTEVLDHEYPGGLDEWVDSMTHFIARRYRDSSWQELGYGLVFCKCDGLGGESFAIKEIKGSYKPPVKPPVKRVPDYILDQVKYLERRRDTAKSELEKKNDQAELDRLKKKYNIK